MSEPSTVIAPSGVGLPLLKHVQVTITIESLPGVRRASVSLLKPGAGGGFRDVVVRLGETREAAGLTATRSPVAPGFFAAVGIPVTQGRDFEWRDNSRGSGVTILSQSLARRLFGNDLLAAYTPALQDQNASFKCFVVRGGNVSFAALKEAVESLGRDGSSGRCSLV